MTKPDTSTSSRKKLEPVGWEDQMCFVDYGDRPGELKSVRMPIHEVPAHCEFLRKKRVDFGYTLKRAAEALGLSPAELSGIEHGRLECDEAEAQRFVGDLATARVKAWEPMP